MRVLDKEELAAFLHETYDTDERLIELGLPPMPSWYEEVEFVKDDYRAWAERILERARVAIKPLLGVRKDGSIPFDLLAAGDCDRVVSRLGKGSGRKVVPQSRLSAEAQAARAPPAPEVLVDALQDRVHHTSGRLLASKPIKISWGK
jgi:hypothetical protein